MRILLISFFFPPYNSIAAVRTGKTAKYLIKFGHEIRVISAINQRGINPTMMPLEIPEDQVVYTDWFNTRRILDMMEKLKYQFQRPFAMAGKLKRRVLPGRITNQNTTSNETVALPKISRIQGLKQTIDSIVNNLVCFPDPYIGWLPYARKAGIRLLDTWKPDIIYASSAPPTSLIVANLLARKYNLPWVGEFRDLWVDNHNYSYSQKRRRLEERLEKRVLTSATGLVTISEPLAEVLKRKYNKPTAVVTNGFDPTDYPTCSEVPYRDGCLRIVYTGMIYRGKQDPSPLFDALQRMGKEAETVQFAYYGAYFQIIQEAATRYHVEHLVEINEPVPYQKSLEAQKNADVLLHLLWNDPKERGMFSGKLFEYFGACRPILAIGCVENVSTDLIYERNAGVALNEPNEIVEQLRQWIKVKQQTGGIPHLPESATLGLSREEQTKVLENFLKEIV